MVETDNASNIQVSKPFRGASFPAKIKHNVNTDFQPSFDFIAFDLPSQPVRKMAIIINDPRGAATNKVAEIQRKYEHQLDSEQQPVTEKKSTDYNVSDDEEPYIKLLHVSSNNETQTLQPSDCNESQLWQYGKHNNSSSAQNGRCNSISVKQIGLKTGTEILQLGDYNRAISVQRGSDLHLTNIQSGEFNYSNDWQEGSYNNILLIQSGSSNFHMGTQIGTDNQLTIIQTN